MLTVIYRFTRSEYPGRGKKGGSSSKPRILETRHDTSDGFSKMIRASDEGIYEVVSIKDRFCSFTKPSHKNAGTGGGGLMGGQKKLLT